MEYLNNFKNENIPELIKILFEKIDSLEKENKSIKQEMISIKRVNQLQIKSLNEKVMKLQSEIRNLREINTKNLEKKLIENEKIKKIKIKEIKSISEHENWITHIDIFPNKNFITVSMDKSIGIFNKDGILIKKIINAHEDYINHVNINPRNNNFITCSYDNSIKIWSLINNEYLNIKTILNAHENRIWKVSYYNIDKEDIISCSDDSLLKIWEKMENNEYQCKIILTHSGTIKSFLLLNDYNMFVSAGNFGTFFWDMNFYSLIKNIKEGLCFNKNALQKIGNDNIIVSGGIYHKIRVININSKIIIREIDNSFQCYDICQIPSFRLFFVCGASKNIKIYREDNYESIQVVTNAHNNFINGFLFLDNDIFISYSYLTFKIWKLEIN